MLCEWYKTVRPNSSIEQGDIIFNCPIIEVAENTTLEEIISGEETLVKVSECHMIVISQSCDIQNGSIDYVQLCPIRLLGEAPKLRTADKISKLKKDQIVRFALLEKNDRKSFPNDYFIVDLASVQSLPLAFLKEVAKKTGKRLRLCSPYREYLSQKFAYLFMRVGKPKNISDILI